MSNLETAPGVLECGGRHGIPAEPVAEVLAGREVVLGESTRVRRLLPTLGRRLIGPWCFIDHYGPDDIAHGPGMQVPPHPHIGLQTVSWLLAGEVHHRDSIGGEAVIRPGELALMTAGRAITHAEQSPVRHPALLHGAQLWVALPEADRAIAPDFTHHTDLPVLTEAGLTATVLLGEMAGAASPGRVYSPLVGIDLALDPGAGAGTETVLPLEPDFEHAVLTATGTAEVAGTRLDPGTLLYLGTGRRELRLRADAPARLLLLGGEPFTEQVIMWWNFLGSSGEEIAAAREAWATGDRFGTVTGYHGNPLPAPPLPQARLRPRGRTR